MSWSIHNCMETDGQYEMRVTSPSDEKGGSFHYSHRILLFFFNLNSSIFVLDSPSCLTLNGFRHRYFNLEFMLSFREQLLV